MDEQINGEGEYGMKINKQEINVNGATYIIRSAIHKDARALSEIVYRLMKKLKTLTEKKVRIS